MQYVFVDEAGNFDFSDKGSQFYVVTAITVNEWQTLAMELLSLRMQLAVDGAELGEFFHASEERQAVRDRVFSIIQSSDLIIDAVVLDKRKTLPGIAKNHDIFYKLAWKLLFQYVSEQRLKEESEIFIAASSIGTKREKILFRQALQSVALAHSRDKKVATAFWAAGSHPLLQVADYCSWAIQRWKEKDDDRSWILIEPKVQSCFEPFKLSEKTYY